jgi:uncharacterized protein YcgI (DUF1989 family)
MDCCCHSNLTRAVAEYGLKEEDVHDVLNAFMCTGEDEVRSVCCICQASQLLRQL